MKNKVFILICLLVGIAFNSCNCNKTTSSKEQLDTVWNLKSATIIQYTIKGRFMSR